MKRGIPADPLPFPSLRVGRGLAARDYLIAKLSTMTQDAMVYKVSSCSFFYGEFFVFDCSSARTRANPFH